MRAAGYNEEKVVLLASADIPVLSMSCEIVADAMRRIGLKVDLQTMDYGTVAQRRGNRAPPNGGGWSAFINRFDGATLMNPGVALITRGNGTSGYFGWPDSPALEELYRAWLKATSQPDRIKVSRDIQLQMWRDATSFPLGQILLPYAFSNKIVGIQSGFPKFFNVLKST